MAEGKTHHERVVGGTEEQKRAALKDLQETFEARKPELAEYEIEKTEKDREIIGRVEAIIDEMVKEWRGDPKPLPLEKVYVVQPGAVEKIAKGESGGSGIHFPTSLNIAVEKQESPLAFASTLAHELFHLKSYKAAQISRSTGETELYRSGMSMIDRKDPTAAPGEEKEHFGDLEEAIVAECVKRFLRRIGKDPMFAEEAQANETIKNWIVDAHRRMGDSPEKLRILRDELKYIAGAEERVKEVENSSGDEKERADYAAGMFRRLYEEGKVESLERWRQRERLYKLLDEIVEKSNGKFKDRDDIFNEFAEANFTGNYLTIARTIEGALGQGSFRRLGNEFATESRGREEKG